MQDSTAPRPLLEYVDAELVAAEEQMESSSWADIDALAEPETPDGGRRSGPGTTPSSPYNREQRRSEHSAYALFAGQPSTKTASHDAPAYR